MAKSTGKKKINFGDVPPEIRGGGTRAAHVPEGDYLLKVVKGEWREKKDESGSYINWQFSIISPTKYKGKTVYDITSLKPDALWNLRNLIHAATGKNVAGKAVNFDPTMLEGKVVAATLEDDEFNNKTRSRPVDYRPKAELKAKDKDDDEDEEDEEDEVEEEEEDEDLDDVDVEDL